MDDKFLFKTECYAIIGAMMEVHRVLGKGFLEGVYQEALSLEFERQNIPFEKEKKLNIIYKGIPLDKFYIADFVCYDEIIIEVKSSATLTNEHDAQLINYLKATNLKVGILANFGESSLKYKRIIY